MIDHQERAAGEREHEAFDPTVYWLPRCREQLAPTTEEDAGE